MKRTFCDICGKQIFSREPFFEIVVTGYLLPSTRLEHDFQKKYCDVCAICSADIQSHIQKRIVKEAGKE